LKAPDKAAGRKHNNNKEGKVSKKQATDSKANDINKDDRSKKRSHKEKEDKNGSSEKAPQKAPERKHDDKKKGKVNTKKATDSKASGIKKEAKDKKAQEKAPAKAQENDKAEAKRPTEKAASTINSAKCTSKINGVEIQDQRAMQGTLPCDTLKGINKEDRVENCLDNLAAGKFLQCTGGRSFRCIPFSDDTAVQRTTHASTSDEGVCKGIVTKGVTAKPHKTADSVAVLALKRCG